MAKRVDKGHDATQELSASQLVANMPPRRPNPQNDASMWLRNVVSSDDFAPTRSAAPARRRWPLVLVGVIAIGAAVGGYFLFIRDSDKPVAAGAPVASTAPSAVPPAVPATVPAAPADASVPLDAAAAAATVDGGVAETAMVADAISSVGPVIKVKATRKQTKQGTTKKKSVAKPATKKASPKRK